MYDDVYFFTGKEYTENNPAYMKVVKKFVTAFADLKPILLIEMGRVTEYNDEQKDNLMILLTESGGVQVVISRSSVSEYFLPREGAYKFDVYLPRIINRSCEIAFKPFESEEVTIFMEAYPGLYGGGNKDFLENLAQGNPLLLSLCSVQENEYCAEWIVNKEVSSYVSSIIGSLQFQHWIRKNLLDCF